MSPSVDLIVPTWSFLEPCDEFYPYKIPIFIVVSCFHKLGQSLIDFTLQIREKHQWIQLNFEQSTPSAREMLSFGLVNSCFFSSFGRSRFGQHFNACTPPGQLGLKTAVAILEKVLGWLKVLMLTIQPARPSFHHLVSRKVYSLLEL